jgi:predicted transcriptional regulator
MRYCTPRVAPAGREAPRSLGRAHLAKSKKCSRTCNSPCTGDFAEDWGSDYTQVIQLGDVKRLASSATTQLADAINTVVHVDRSLAQSALDEARLARADAGELAKAQEDLARGDAFAARSVFANAIQQYKNAWGHVNERSATTQIMMVPMTMITGSTTTFNVKLSR